MEGLYIVFLIDSKYKSHDGKVFRSLSDAREYCQGVIQDHYADKIVIGIFTLLKTLIEFAQYVENLTKQFRHYREHVVRNVDTLKIKDIGMLFIRGNLINNRSTR